MKAKILLFLSFAFFISCDKSGIYSKFDNLDENNRWMQSEAKTYEFTVDNDTILYDIKFHFSHVYDYQFSNVPINFSIESPNGEKENFTIDLAIKNDQGEQLANCSGDICDLIYNVKEKIKLQKGNYKITVSNSFKGPYLPNVIGVGLEVDKAE